MFDGGDSNLYGYVGTVGKPGIETNLYGYSFQDPVNFIDPSGKWGIPEILIGGALVAIGTHFIFDVYLDPIAKRSMEVVNTQIKLSDERNKIDNAHRPGQCPIPKNSDRPALPDFFTPSVPNPFDHGVES